MKHFLPEDRYTLRSNGRAAAQRDALMTTLVRGVISAADAKLNPGTRPHDHLRQKWGEGGDDVALLLRAATIPATTGVSGWAAELAPTITSAAVSSLVPVSAAADLMNRILPLSFDGARKISVPNVTLPLGDFVMEASPIPVVQAITGSVPIEPYKFAAITVLSRETTEGANAEPLVRQAMLDGTGPSLDRGMLSANPAVPGLRPAGLLNGKTALTPSTDSMVSDLAALAAAVSVVAGNGGIVFIASAKQAVAIRIGLLTDYYPVLASTALPDRTVIAVALNGVVAATGNVPAIDVSKAATVQMSDTPVDGGITTAPTIVSWQNDVVAIRLRWPISWAVRDARAISFMSAVNW
jgi:hypothetical protein